MFAILLFAGLVIAPAAAAKGPHAVVTSGPDPVLPGVPWEATVELNEFRDSPAPLLMAVGRDGHVDAKVRRAAASIEGAVAFKTTMVFPEAGRWRLMLVAGKRRFELPALKVGSAVEPKDYVAFPVGSEAARQDAGGELVTDEQRVSADGGDALPPEVITAADEGTERDGGGFPVWLLPILGVVMVGVGAAAVTRLGSR
jgi:hypothetical protein